MAQSVGERCLENLFARLAAITGFAGLVCERNREEEVTEFDRLLQQEGDEQTIDESVGVTTKGVDVTIEAHLQGPSKAALITKVDALKVAVYAAALGEPRLGGLAHDVRETGFSRRIEGGSKPTAWFALGVVVEYQHAELDITATV